MSPFVIDPPEAPPLTEESTEVGFVWELVYESLGFHVEDDPGQGYPLRRFCEAWCRPLQPIYEIAGGRSGEAPWAILFDVDRCPPASLPYLAQYVGVEIMPEMSVEQIRNEIRQPTGWRRGQIDSIRIGLRRTLQPVAAEELLVIVRPRTPVPGSHYVRTLLAQTPEPDRSEWVLRRELLPAWEALDYEAITGVTVADVAASAKWKTVADLAATFSSVEALTEILPSEL